MTASAEVFEALGDPTRRRILVALGAGEQSAGALVEVVQQATPMSQPAVSQHLRVLLDAGLVEARSEGRHRLYALDADGIVAARSWLGALLDPVQSLGQPLDALATEVARGRRARRTGTRAQPRGTDTGRRQGRAG